MTNKDEITFRIIAGWSYDNAQATYTVPKGTDIRDICRVLNVDGLRKWEDEKGVVSDYICEGEVIDRDYFHIDKSHNKYLEDLSNHFKKLNIDQNISVLLADDDQLVREDFVCELKRLGYSPVYEAADGNEAYQIFEEKIPNLVLMDTEMHPGPDGYEICLRIRSQPHGKAVKILGMSSNRKYRELWMKAGANYFADKVKLMYPDPDDPNSQDASLESVIKQLLRK